MPRSDSKPLTKGVRNDNRIDKFLTEITQSQGGHAAPNYKERHPMSKKSQFALVTVIGLFLVSFAAVAPRAVKAAIATLVRDVDNPARQPFAAFCVTGSTGGTQAFCTIAIPAGKEVVVQSVSVSASSASAVSPLLVNLITSSGGNELNELYGLFPLQVSVNGLFNEYFDARNLTFSADGGTNITCFASTNFPNPNNGLNAVFNVSGYFVTLP